MKVISSLKNNVVYAISKNQCFLTYLLEYFIFLINSDNLFGVTSVTAWFLQKIISSTEILAGHLYLTVAYNIYIFPEFKLCISC